MRDVLKDASVSSILIAIVGLVLLLMPSLTNRIIVYGIGGVLAVYGIGRIFRYIRRSADAGSLEHDLSAGLVCVVSGLFMILYCPVVISVLPFLFGLALIFGGAMSIQGAFDVRRFHGDRGIEPSDRDRICSCRDRRDPQSFRNGVSPDTICGTVLPDPRDLYIYGK